MIIFAPQQDAWEINQLTPRTRKMVHLINMWLVKEHALHMYITSIIRTEAEQRELCKQMGKPYYASVHQFGRGVDFRVFQDEEVNSRLLEWVNEGWPYDRTRPGKKTLIRHIGTADHFHLQSMT